MSIENILNYIKINDNISTSGQPKEEEFSLLLENEFDIVINLALYNSLNALENEDKIVTSLGMKYFHIPVSFENPSIEDLQIFLNLLNAMEGKKIFIHCAKNYRVSAFMYVYHKYILKTPFENIDLSIFEQWNPEPIWQELMKVDYEDLYKA